MSRFCFLIFMVLCSPVSAESIKIKITELYETEMGFYILGESLTNPCLEQSLEFYFPNDILDSGAVYEATNAFFEKKALSIVYSDQKLLCEDGEMYSMEVISND